ncbi:MAG: glucosamine-6-phosphate deaminase [Candidatus Palauibacterales bacterium]|jgi:glucosamine-6-phosphate deaminase|nr:glucosamine-6-phosphate deaminase [Candidatus Palauibacterales bacterium]MDP2482000.1 glucosamine-6-phosphate deaminase [Candidatus Palauibacterales bacterium]
MTDRAVETDLPYPETHILGGSTERERIRTVVAPEPDDIAVLVARRICQVIDRTVEERGLCVLGLATGSTPLGIYRELIRLYLAGEVDFSRVVTFNLDEYYPMSPESLHSYRRFMDENFFQYVNLPPDHVHLPDGTVSRVDLAGHCERYEQSIADAGGIDFQILGIGRSGHIGFNEPGSPRESRTRLVTLDTITRRDAASDFFGEGNVPVEAITMGIASILDAREIALVATGEHKAFIVRRAVEDEPSADVTASYLQRHPAVTAWLDRAAAGELTRIRTPWVLEEVEWTPEVTERATVWLAERTGKPLLKLAPADYRENHLGGLLARRGPAGQINGQVFNALNGKVRGKSKLVRHKKILVFSPHPDDDVISMGGVLRKLWENENEIVVAYMTSGNIAVFDHDVRRHLDFVERAAGDLELDAKQLRRARLRLEKDFASKEPGEPDSALAQNLKRYIRESEAVAAIAAVGLPRTAARFLDLPFYRTGEVRKRPIGEEDVELVLDLLKHVKPDLVFVAGDLSDPHGTHRMCKQAVDEALLRYRGTAPEVWLYRGAWQEWSITEADVLVPLSQEELREKVFAIFKHQSQKDVAPFPGGYDEREFWQRVRSRNLETAAAADRLGLPEYYAMEAYRVERPAETSD